MNNFYKNKLVLVAGGSGFIGSHIVDGLHTSGAKIRVPLHRRKLKVELPGIEAVQADLTNQEDCLRVLKGVDYIFHAAGSTGSAAVKGSRVMQTISANLILTTQLLQAALASDVKRFLLFSSTTGYPVAEHPVKEEEMWGGPVFPGYFGYGWTKRYLEKLGEFAHSQSSMKVAIIRPSAIYGSRDNFDPESCHVIPALIRRAVANENPFQVWGSGEVVRDFLHVKDLARACLMTLEKYANCDPVNIGYGKAVTIDHVVFQILKASGHQGAKVVYNTSRPSELPFRRVDTKKAEAFLDFMPKISLEDGIKETLEWFKENRIVGEGKSDSR